MDYENQLHGIAMGRGGDTAYVCLFAFYLLHGFLNECVLTILEVRDRQRAFYSASCGRECGAQWASNFRSFSRLELSVRV